MRPARLSGSSATPGTVTLVGAGPGDPGLLTLRGRDALAAADVVVVDRLVAPEVAALARPGARVEYVGKAPGAHSADQAEIEALLVREALAGRRVVRLKGGDPYLFGRGGEEALACLAAGVPCEVVPGVTSAFAVPAAAGVPVTHRGLTQAVTVVSGHLPPGHPGSTVDWGALAVSGASLVVLMGVAHLSKIAIVLQEHGRDGSTPVTVVERGTTPAQRVVRSTLDGVDAAAARAGVGSPAVVVVGAVAGLDLAAAGPAAGPGVVADLAAGASGAAAGGPCLRGVRVLVPRSRPGPSALAGLLRLAGADVVEARVLAPAVDVDALPTAGWLTVPDEPAAEALLVGLRRAGRDVRSLAGLALAGPEAALAPLGLVPDGSVAPGVPVVGRDVTIRLRAVPVPSAVTAAVAAGEIDCVALPSSGTARALADHLASAGTGASLAAAAIGPQTAAAARRGGLPVGTIADEPDLPALVRAVAGLSHRAG